MITGGSTGLGAAMATALAEAGSDIVLMDHHPRHETADIIKSMGRNVLSLTADLADTNQIRSAVEQSVDAFGHIDILVNNAGIIRRNDALVFSEMDWDDVMNLNVKSMFLLSQSCARIMKDTRRGKIINIASLLSFQGGIKVPSYAASKGAVAQLTKALANEWGVLGINVNAIVPGYMATNNTQSLRGDRERERSIVERIPLGRWGTPDDLKGAAVFLASRASDYVNGHLLVVDGGWMAR